MEDAALAELFAADVVLMRLIGMQPVVVHGGGPQITDLMRRLGKEPEFVDGRRVTDAETVDIVRMALVGKVNREIVASMNRHGSYTVGLSGEDAGLLRVIPRDPALGFVGEVDVVDPSIVFRLLNEELIPVIATVGVDDAGQAYNVNADTVAAAIAAAIGAEKLVYLTDVAGLYARWPDEDSLISRIDIAGLEGLLAERRGVERHDPEGRVVHRRAAGRRGSRARARRPPAARDPARAVHPRRCRNHGDPVTVTTDLIALDAEHVMGTYGRFPVEFVRGSGTELFDAEGRRYLDFLSGLAVTSLGHAHPAVAAAIAAQATTLLHTSNLFHTEHQAPLAATLDELLGGGGRTFFANSGAEANECAIKLAASLRAAARRARSLPRRLRVRVVPRPHPHHARGDRTAAEAGDVPAAARRLPPGGLRRARRARGRARRPGLRGAARSGAGRGWRAARAGGVPARGAPVV